MIPGLLWLLGCQLVGELIVGVLHVTVPGPVVGMVLLLVVLRTRRVPTGGEAEADIDTDVDEAEPGRGRGAGLVTVADALLSHLQLLFVPAGVGVVAYAGLLRQQALPLGVALVVSWAAGLLVVGGVVTVFLRRGPRPAGVRDPR